MLSYSEFTIGALYYNNKYGSISSFVIFLRLVIGNYLWNFGHLLACTDVVMNKVTTENEQNDNQVFGLKCLIAVAGLCCAEPIL